MHGTGRVNKKLYNLKNFHLKGKLREKKLLHKMYQTSIDFRYCLTFPSTLLPIYLNKPGGFGGGSRDMAREKFVANSVPSDRSDFFRLPHFFFG